MTAPSPDPLAALVGKLLPCPFCGQMPEHFGSGEGQRGLMIECITPGCVNPCTSWYDHASAIATWNRRATALDASRVGVVLVPRSTLEVAAKALNIAADWHVEEMEIEDLPPEMKHLYEPGDEPGWVNVSLLADHFARLAADAGGAG